MLSASAVGGEGVTLAPSRDLAAEMVAMPSGVAAALRRASGLTPIDVFTPGWTSISLAGRPSLLDSTVDGARALRLNDAIPALSHMVRPATPFRFAPRSEADRRRALRCLTQAVYYEAALEDEAGRLAVAQVVLNRVRDQNYPNSICGVVYQGAERITGCQFSFTCDGALSRPPVDWAWRRAEETARQALAGRVAAQVGTATHYHADYVYAWWSPALVKLAQIGAHIFYRWPGAAGETAAFSKPYAGAEPVIDEARFARPRVMEAVEAAQALESAGAAEEVRTVQINGQTRTVGVVSLGGRRLPTRDEVAEINARLSALEKAAPPPPGVTELEVEEVNRPAPSGSD
ncbi:cell wall hydrolase [Brevundimonas sp. 2R-24]|uniref:Cell wall hydrolase n=1 Tax=Peiella sedimenti TaxID=3061083 RepID=A0ABT8SPV3_9CAUL|nr:cell wall hydrolase [Caulobacteraceae bacterium XZ-24]